MPETVYDRRPLIPPATSSEVANQDDEKVLNKSLGNVVQVDNEKNTTSVPSLVSYRQSLRVFTGTYATGDTVWMILWRPFALLGSPTVLVRTGINDYHLSFNKSIQWAIAIYGTAITCTFG